MDAVEQAFDKLFEIVVDANYEIFDGDPAFGEDDDAVPFDEWSDGDPIGVYESQGNETMWFKIHEFPDNRAGPAYWYVANISVEGD